MTIEKLSDTRIRLTLEDGKEILLVGTAHVSLQSVDEVTLSIESEEPDHICLELDDGRMKNKEQENSWSNMDVKKVIKEGKAFLLVANMALASFQKRMGDSSGTAPGEEILSAARIAKEKGIPYSLCDRDIQTTFKRAWRMSNLWNKSKLIATIISAVFTNEEISEEELEELKQADVMQNMMEELARELPSVKSVLIDERDRYLATSIFLAPGTKKLAVVGAGHMGGIVNTIEALEQQQISTDLEDISVSPPAGKGGKILSWAFPILIVSIIVFGFVRGGSGGGIKMFSYWLAVNMSFTALGAIIALAHPLNIIVSALSAPITALHPAIGVGMVSGIVEATLRKPKVKDFEKLSDDATTFRGWYRNRLLHTLIVFLFTSLAASIANVVVFPLLLKMLV
ncbi:MAG: TraB/GumN family protein [Sphaerochaeta sp.]|nr:TraB/GumN family protein [Sphaerochaeta sp.]